MPDSSNMARTASGLAYTPTSVAPQPPPPKVTPATRGSAPLMSYTPPPLSPTQVFSPPASGTIHAYDDGAAPIVRADSMVPRHAELGTSRSKTALPRHGRRVTASSRPHPVATLLPGLAPAGKTSSGTYVAVLARTNAASSLETPEPTTMRLTCTRSPAPPGWHRSRSPT